MPHAAVVRTVLDEGGFLDLATTGEVHLVRRLGVTPERCIHTHPIKRPQDIRNALDFGMRTFVVDNPDEVRKFERLADRVELLLRVSFRSPGAMCDLSRKFGCDPEDALALARAGRGARHHGARPLVPCRLAGRGLGQARRGDPGVREAHVGRAQGEARAARYAGHRRRLSHRLCAAGAGHRPVLRAAARGARAKLPKKVRVIAEPGRYIVGSGGDRRRLA